MKYPKFVHKNSIPNPPEGFIWFSNTADDKLNTSIEEITEKYQIPLKDILISSDVKDYTDAHSIFLHEKHEAFVKHFWADFSLLWDILNISQVD